MQTPPIDRGSPEFIMPFDWAVDFTRKHFRTILKLALLPLIIDLICVRLAFFFPLTGQQEFVLAILNFMAFGWMVVSMLTLVIVSFKDEPQSVFGLFQRSFNLLPKFILSALFLMLVASSLERMPLLLLLLVFLIWAPFFSAADGLAISFRKEDEDSLFNLDADDEVMAMRAIKRQSYFFADRPLWDLGLGRSTNFVMRNFALTVQLLLLFWAAFMVPFTVIFLFGGTLYSFADIVIKNLISFPLSAFVTGVTCAAFIRAFPAAVLQEFNIKPVVAQPIEPTNASKTKSRKLQQLVVFISVVAFICSYFPIQNFIDTANELPDGVSVGVEKAEASSAQLVITMRLEDPNYLFRWFKTDSLVFKVVDANAKVENMAAGVADPSKEPGLIEPQRVIPSRADNGEKLDEGGFTPLSGPLRLTVHLDNTASVAELANKKLVVYHRSYPLVAKPIVNYALTNISPIP